MRALQVNGAVAVQVDFDPGEALGIPAPADPYFCAGSHSPGIDLLGKGQNQVVVFPRLQTRRPEDLPEGGSRRNRAHLDPLRNPGVNCVQEARIRCLVARREGQAGDERSENGAAREPGAARPRVSSSSQASSLLMKVGSSSSLASRASV